MTNQTTGDSGNDLTLHWRDANVDVHKVVVGPFDNNVFVVRCHQTGEAILIDAANEGGGRDNITTVIADIVAAEDASMPSKAQALASRVVVDEGDPTNEQAAISVDGESTVDDEAGEDAVEAAVPKQRWSWRR